MGMSTWATKGHVYTHAYEVFLLMDSKSTPIRFVPVDEQAVTISPQGAVARNSMVNTANNVLHSRRMNLCGEHTVPPKERASQSLTYSTNKIVVEDIEGGEGVAKNFGLQEEREVEGAFAAAGDDALKLDAS